MRSASGHKCEAVPHVHHLYNQSIHATRCMDEPHFVAGLQSVRDIVRPLSVRPRLTECIVRCGTWVCCGANYKNGRQSGAMTLD